MKVLSDCLENACQTTFAACERLSTVEKGVSIDWRLLFQLSSAYISSTQWLQAAL